ncbi:MAG: hypothetical protein OQL16_00045 [Gammaproteobacteria bacterium]|nr:hypothetical protein [Gammaproteobacteria bacterium]
MHAAEPALASFFEQVAQKDNTLLNTIKQEACFRLDQAQWHFTLPDLYSFLQLYDDVFNLVDYSQFRQLVFSSTVNQDIKPYGAEIIITDNQGKVDKTGYALVWQTG